jgi:hypothetical protein
MEEFFSNTLDTDIPYVRSKYLSSGRCPWLKSTPCRRSKPNCAKDSQGIFLEAGLWIIDCTKHAISKIFFTMEWVYYVSFLQGKGDGINGEISA